MQVLDAYGIMMENEKKKIIVSYTLTIVEIWRNSNKNQKKSHMHEIDRSTNTGVMNNNAYLSSNFTTIFC